ncbi:hypothetical protein CesoFtcFv8_002880 [Champsocephalus esox]|uniref:Uncharacterized protein n=2 Tax=Champsocephalus TaxID=52236 RepID=A0AAN8E722_CHAGU|nr:hypothetical protein CesoFtcFv8_002880 [Champsocephalus esox]KAK5934559.1 hypothetical protein CgunFtcFv8_014949 [Champsocephalus gunnari]
MVPMHIRGLCAGGERQTERGISPVLPRRHVCLHKGSRECRVKPAQDPSSRADDVLRLGVANGKGAAGRSPSLGPRCFLSACWIMH